MAPLVVPSAAQLRLHWSMSTQTAYNVLGLRLGPGAVIDVTTANELAANVSSAFTTATLAAHIDNGTQISAVGVRDLRVAYLPEVLATNFSPKVGTGTGNRSGYANSLCVTLRTAKAGKSFRGRVYLPLDAAGAVDEDVGEYNTTASQAGRNFIQMLRQAIAASAILAGNFSLAVISRLPGAEVSTPVTNELVRSNILTSQRRRHPRRP